MLWSACEMKPVITSTSTEVLQNSLVGRYDVVSGKHLFYSSGEGSYHVGSEVSMTQKGSSTGVPGAGT